MKSYKVKCSNCQLAVINGIPCHEQGCNNITVFEYRGKAFARYRVFSLDVWGNKNDGFEVNDRSEAGHIMVPIDSPDKAIIQALKKAGLLNPRCRFSSFTVDGDDRGLYLDNAKTSEPIYQLEIE